mgnify:FL=1|jgi:hypothetical protein|uniref:NinG recombination protein n=1 Tax=Siphoviridae sp. ctLsx2 TaxID=2826254 RepID=A0A8S5QTL2_9CAUD|nr:MAG TPA: NinG recombination protein [Siphoviridae sp. ctLsx2]
MARNYAALPYDYLEEMEALNDAEFGRLTRALLSYSMTGEQIALCGNERFYAKRVMSQEDRFKKFEASGPWHWNWKGGITPQNKRDRTSYKYRDWRKRVFERDNYTCQICGCRGGELNAHHKKRWCDYPDLRYDVENGITLCESCHRSVHKEGGGA